MEEQNTPQQISSELIPAAIFFIRGQKVMLSTDLAKLYGIEVRSLIQAIKRNFERFPEDFMFQLTQDEWDTLKPRSQFVTLNSNLKSQNVISSWGGVRALPYAFTEQGVAMLSSVLRSSRAVSV